MDPGADTPGSGEPPIPSSSSTPPAAAAADTQVPNTKQTVDINLPPPPPQPPPPPPAAAAATATATASASSSRRQVLPSRYGSQKRRDWNSFLQYLKDHKPGPLALSCCSSAHVIEFLKYLDQFGKTKVHAQGCVYFGHPSPPAPCECPLRQAWGSLDALIGRLRAAYEENGGSPESNPFGVKAVRIYLREVRESQAKARGIPYEKKKRKKRQQTILSTTRLSAAAAVDSSERAAAATTGIASGEETTKEGEGSGTVTSTSTSTSVPQ